MGELDNTTLIAIIAGTVGVGQILARVVEKLVTGLLEERKERKKNSKRALDPGKEKGGSTTDLALQQRDLAEMATELDETKRVAYDTKAAVTKDLPHFLERMEGKLDSSVDRDKEVLQELRTVSRATDNNTAATKALHNFLARSS